MSFKSLLNSKSGRVAFTGIFAALSLILGLVESLLPTGFLAVPGIKLGLSNIAVLFAVYYLGKKEGFAVMVAKVMLSALLYAGFNGFLYSAAGGLLSFAVICLLVNVKFFSVIGVSAAAGTAHNIGQLLIAVMLVKTTALFNYMPVLIAAGCITGILNGIASYFVIKYTKKLENP